MFSKSESSFSGAEHSNSSSTFYFLLSICLVAQNKESGCNSGDLGSIPGFGKIPWRKEWLPITVFLPRKSYGQRSLAGYSLWGNKEWDKTEQLTLVSGIEVRTGHGTTDWFQIGKGVHQGCILSPCLFNLYAIHGVAKSRTRLSD